MKESFPFNVSKVKRSRIEYRYLGMYFENIQKDQFWFQLNRTVLDIARHTLIHCKAYVDTLQGIGLYIVRRFYTLQGIGLYIVRRGLYIASHRLIHCKASVDTLQGIIFYILRNK